MVKTHDKLFKIGVGMLLAGAFTALGFGMVEVVGGVI